MLIILLTASGLVSFFPTSARIPVAADTVRIVSWNVSWLGHPDFPPVDDALQVQNVGRVLDLLQADIYALQEVSSETAFQELLRKLGGSFGGLLGRANGDQRLGIIYRTSIFRPIDVPHELASDADYFAGRPPLVIRGILDVGSEAVRVTLVNVHLKAFSDADAYERRRRSVERLIAFLAAEPPGTALIVTGDFNDESIASTSEGRSSSLEPFQRDSSYVVASRELEEAGSFTYCSTKTCDVGSMLDHFVVATGRQPISAASSISSHVLDLVPDYVRSTSDHLPIMLSLAGPNDVSDPRLEGSAFVEAVYPNPFSGQLTILVRASEYESTVNLVDILGRIRYTRRLPPSHSHSRVEVDGNGFADGLYFVRTQSHHGTDVHGVVHVRSSGR